jgi:RND family efflux transporter MFP subunit
LWVRALAFSAMSALVACSRRDPGAAQAAESQDARLPVVAVTLTEERLELSAEYLAQLVSRRRVALYSQVVGNVREILVKPGDTVRAGDTLLRIDPRREHANLQSLIAGRAQKQASLALAESTLDRSRRLQAEGLLSQQQYDQDRSFREVAAQELRAQDAAIRAQSAELAFYDISAPFAGVVGDVPVKLGDLVSPTLQLTSVVDNSVLEAYVNLPVDQLPLLSPESRIRVLDSEQRTLADAPVSFVAPEANAAAQSVLIKALIPNSASLRAAQMVRAQVVYRSSLGVRVPVSAVTRQSAQYFVYVVEGSDARAVARQRAVELGALKNDHYDVQRGLVPGDRLIVSQLQKLHDGAPISVGVPPAPSSAPASAAKAAPAH